MILPRTTTSRLAAFIFFAATALTATAQTAKPTAPSSHTATPASASALEQRAQRIFAADRKDPPALEALLRRMPKGGDLHVHLSGEVYAETFLREAVADHLCFNLATLTLDPSSGMAGGQPRCPDVRIPSQPLQHRVPAATAFTDQKVYDAMIDAFSMRGFVPSAGVSGHDQFFATFARFDALGNNHAGEWLDEVVSRAAAQNEQYMEIMLTPPFSKAAALGSKLGWPAGAAESITREQLIALRVQLLTGGIRNEIADDVREFAAAEAERRNREHCGTPAATPACSVEVRWIYQVLRGFPPQQVFAQTVLGFEVASADPTVAGINFVMPEDGYVARRDYHLQMQMLDYLHSVYPKVHITLHAGELASGLVPDSDLSFHIRQAVELGHAERIGHGVDILQEDDAEGLLREMAAKHIMVEINLSSNDLILGVKAPNHPLPSYRAAHVPVALSTDDEGVSRIDLTHEYTRAALEFDLSYRDLKDMARTGLEHSFLSGDSLWTRPDDFTVMSHGCRPPAADGKPTPVCESFLSTSQRAAQQWELERRFHVFEDSLR